MDSRTVRQHESVEKWKKSGGNGIIEACTGFGKTRMATNIIRELKIKKPDLSVLIIVPQANLKQQWERHLAEFTNCKVLVINTALHSEHSVNLVIYDEIHTIASDQRIKILDYVHSNLTLGLTGTIKRLDGLESRILSRIPIIDTITMTEATEKGWVSQSIEFKVLLEVDDIDKYNEYNKKFSSYFSFFGQDFPIANRCAHDWKARASYSKLMNCSMGEVNAHAFGFSRMLSLRKQYVYGHPEKVRVANMIIDKLKDKKIITFSMSQDVAEKIKPSVVYHSKMKKKEREKIISDFNEVKSGVLSTVKAADAGVDLAGLNCAIFLAGSSSEIQLIQRKGRAVRKEGDKVTMVFHLLIPGTVEMGWFSNANKNNDPPLVLTMDNLIKFLNGEEYVAYQDTDSSPMYYS